MPEIFLCEQFLLDCCEPAQPVMVCQSTPWHLRRYLTQGASAHLAPWHRCDSLYDTVAASPFVQKHVLVVDQHIMRM